MRHLRWPTVIVAILSVSVIVIVITLGDIATKITIVGGIIAGGVVVRGGVVAVAGVVAAVAIT
jgi:hypothetical protein